MKYAFLQGNTVWKIEDNFSEIALECSDTVEVGYTYSNGVFLSPLDVSKRKKSGEFNLLRLIKLNEPLLYDGHYYDADKVSSANVVAVVSAINAGIPLPEGFTWRTADNQNVVMDTTKLIGLAATMLVYTNTIYATSWYYKNLVDSATTIQEVESISWV